MSGSLRPHGLYSPWNSPGQNTVVGSLSLLQGIFPTQGWNPGLQHCRWILYPLSQGKPKNTGVGSFSFLQGIFLTQKSNQSLLHCRQILYQLSSEGSPTLLDWQINWTYEHTLRMELAWVEGVYRISPTITLCLTSLMCDSCLDNSTGDFVIS